MAAVLASEERSWVSGCTRVQLRSPDNPDERPLRCRLLYGKPAQTVPNRLGRVAIFHAGQIVAYLVEHGRAHTVFVFRTLDEDRFAGDGVKLLGVWPRVHLLIGDCRRESIDQMWRLFRELRRSGVDPSQLRDGFWARVGHGLGGRATQKTIEELMRHELERA